MWKMPQIIKKKKKEMLKIAITGIMNAKIAEMCLFLLPKILHQMIFQKGRRN